MKTLFAPLAAALFCALSAFNSPVFGQLITQSPQIEVAFGAKATLSLGRKKATFSNISAAFSIMRPFRRRQIYFIPAYQLSANFYSTGLGSSILDQRNRKANLDVVSSFLGIMGGDDGVDDRPKFVRPFNQLTATALFHKLDGGLAYGTNFVVNNHGRNQRSGFLGANVDQIQIGYYNDGGGVPLVNMVNDGFDRYWTGGMHLQVGLDVFGAAKGKEWAKNQFLDWAYDRFTGDVQQAYRLSTALLLSNVPQRNAEEIFVNRALFSFRLRGIEGSSTGIGYVGNCSTCDIQDFIHNAKGYAKHPSKATPVLVGIGSFQKNFFQQVKL